MRREVYEEVSRLLALPVGANPHIALLLKTYGCHGLTFDAFVSIFAQENQQKVIQNNAFVKQRVRSFTDRYLQGADVLQLAVDADFPPCMLMRRMLEDLLPTASKQVIAEILRHPARLDSWLASASETQEHQTHKHHHQQHQHHHHHHHHHSHRHQQHSRQQQGHEYELLLVQELRNAGVTWFLTESELRSQGYFKTPDVRLQVPIAVRHCKKGCGGGDGGGNGSSEGCGVGPWRVVTWIDSKATFGDDRVHRKQLEEQYVTYVNRFGPGLVIYWFGYIDDLDCDSDVILMDHFPCGEELSVLQQATPALPSATA